MSADPLQVAVGSLGGLVGHYGYLAVAGLILVEDFGVPAPGETVLILAAIDAGTGRLNIVLVAVLAFIAAVVGDNIGYGIGHAGGRRLLDRYGRYVLLTPARLDRAHRIVERHGGKVVAAARFVEGFRQANGLLAGAMGMAWRRFLLFNIIGAAAWVGVWATLGFALGDHLTAIYHQVSRYEVYLLAAGAVVVAALVSWRILRHRRRDRSSPDAETHPGKP